MSEPISSQPLLSCCNHGCCCRCFRYGVRSGRLWVSLSLVATLVAGTTQSTQGAFQSLGSPRHGLSSFRKKLSSSQFLSPLWVSQEKKDAEAKAVNVNTDSATAAEAKEVINSDVEDEAHSPPAVQQPSSSGSVLFSLTSSAKLNQRQLASSPSSSSSSSSPARATKFRRLRDLMWVRDTLEDLTGAEFALSILQEEDDERAAVAVSPPPKRRKRAVDYEKLLSQLNRRIRDLGFDQEEDGYNNVNSRDDNDDSNNDSPTAAATKPPTLKPDKGMGSIAYTQEQREALLGRLLVTQYQLSEMIRGRHERLEQQQQDGDQQDNNNSNKPFGIELPEIQLPEIRVEIPREDFSSGGSEGPKLYVRDDGTVDWDGALQDRAALKKFGTAVWARINGQDPETVNGEHQQSHHHQQQHGEAERNKSRIVTANIEETPTIREEKARLNKLTSELAELEVSHTALLNSAISAGQAVANVNLATLDPVLRRKIRESSAALEKKNEEVTFQTMVYELERIYTYLATDLGNPAAKGYIPLQDRLNVAEFGLLESQIENFNRQFEDTELLDADVLAVVMDQLTDFKRRLGIDYYVTGLSYDREAIQQWFSDLLVKTKKGIAFYVKGVKLFWNDLVYSLYLIGRAGQGYTLKPREVRNLRRTFKDIVTFIPVVIILIIPLSPVGHVLVFGAIQRFFPDFFPSCFTEQRQNLLELYESTEYSELTINENLKEKMSRLMEAVVFFVVTSSRNIYLKINQELRGEPQQQQQQQQDETLNAPQDKQQQ